MAFCSILKIFGKLNRLLFFASQVLISLECILSLYDTENNLGFSKDFLYTFIILGNLFINLDSTVGRVGRPCPMTQVHTSNKYKITRMHRRSKPWHLLDYVIVCPHNFKDITITQVMWVSECWRDHRLIQSAFTLHTVPLHQGSTTHGPWTGTGSRHARNWTTQTKPDPQDAGSSPWKTFLCGTSLWCHKGWGPLLCTISNQRLQNVINRELQKINN